MSRILDITPETYLAHIAQALVRIADAFEEQNRYNLAWIEQQKEWRAEDEKLRQQYHDENLAIEREQIEIERNSLIAWERGESWLKQSDTGTIAIDR